jgi:HAE1 family hydrophobic/amphiphilic exporter-1
VVDVFDIGGFSFSGSSPNGGLMFTLLKPWSERNTFDTSILGILYGPDGLMGKFAKQIPEAGVYAFNPPAIAGVGSIGGFSYELEDRGNVGLQKLSDVATRTINLANQPGGATQQVLTQFHIDAPQLQVEIDRNKAKAIGVNLSDLFGTMQVDLGSAYVNDFDYLNRSYRVYVQADTQYRDRVSSLNGLYVRSALGGIVPVSDLVHASVGKSPPTITHYNLFRSIEIDGSAASGHGSGQAIDRMQQIAKQVDPPGVTYEWSGLSLEEIQGGSLAAIIFGLGIVFVYLVLCAQYESFVDPLIVILAVPAALLGALLFIKFRTLLGVPAAIINFGFPNKGLDWLAAPFSYFGNTGLSQDAYTQVGYVMLIGLASKSAILIVEFANQQIRAGATVVEAALRAAQTRLRPILMTSIAFVIAVLPLVLAQGAGSGARQSLGTAVFGGMLISTFLNLIITPVLYVVIKGWELRGKSEGKTVPATNV